ncbi:hypothetical protein EMN47_12860 [Prolixibacteraceae bacterium JC049]|nr:hypothetical protein [Prolixibacteraceae bacterium JC049]
MRITTLFFVFLLLWGCNNGTDKAVSAFKELHQVLQKENGTTWNKSLDGPLVLVDRATRTIIANEGDNAGKLEKKADYYIGKLPKDINIANTAFNWNGKRWTMVALPLPKNKFERLNLLIHESFHRIQPDLGFTDLHEIQSKHLDSKEGRIYLKLELEALKQALVSNAPIKHLKKALMFRQYRYQHFPEAKKAENSLEINEGLAEYTGSILSGRADSDLKKHYSSKIDWFYTMPTFVRSFAYFTIPVYGYFMQQTEKGWNLRIKKNTNLTDFIQQFWSVSTSTYTEEEIKQAGKLYGITTITEFETQRAVKREKLISTYKQQFLTDSVVELDLLKMRISFDPTNIMPLDSLGTVYPNLRISDKWGILKIDSCGALMSPKWNKVTISNPRLITDSVITGKGWKLSLNKSWQLHFTDNKFKVSLR